MIFEKLMLMNEIEFIHYSKDNVMIITGYKVVMSVMHREKKNLLK